MISCCADKKMQDVLSSDAWSWRYSWALRSGTGVVAAILAMLSAPWAVADRAPAVEQAVASARRAAPCGPLKYDATIEHAADIINRSTYTFLNHTAENVPIDDPHPVAITKDLGITASKVTSLQGAGRTTANAVKGMLLEGRNDLPDCSYTNFGTSMLYEERSGYTLVVVLLVGP